MLTSSLDESSGITLDLAPDPLGPTTLPEHFDMQDFALVINERISHGDAFIPPGTRERMQERLQNTQAKLQLVLEARPDLASKYAEHGELVKRYHKAKSSEDQEAASLESECAELAEEIVAIERSVDVGEVEN